LFLTGCTQAARGRFGAFITTLWRERQHIRTGATKGQWLGTAYQTAVWSDSGNKTFYTIHVVFIVL